MAREFERRIKQLNSQLSSKTMADLAFDVFYKNTPVRTGNARRNTGVQNSQIDAAYPYAGRLDEGYSKQSPRGMTVPTIKFLQDYVKKVGK